MFRNLNELETRRRCAMVFLEKTLEEALPSANLAECMQVFWS
jgi:hypothetical protein